LKKTKLNIIFAWTLLLFFAVGQYMVFAHQHKVGSDFSNSKTTTQVLKERCDVCDAMHHTHMLLTQHVYFTPVVAVLCHYQEKRSDVTLIQLVIAAGRAPPIS
jgi:hypothetical protein